MTCAKATDARPRKFTRAETRGALRSTAAALDTCLHCGSPWCRFYGALVRPGHVMPARKGARR